MSDSDFDIRQYSRGDLNLLREVCTLIDRRLDDLTEEMDEHGDPDDRGLFDRFEALASLGLLAFHQFMSQAMGKAGGDPRRRRECLALGPRYNSATTVAEVLEAGATFVKHCGEPMSNNRAKAILEDAAIWSESKARMPPGSEYPMANLLTLLARPEAPRFRHLLPTVETWRTSVFAWERD